MTLPSESPSASSVQTTGIFDQAVLRSIAQESADCIKVLDLDARLLSMNETGHQAMEIGDFEDCRSLLWLDFWQGDDRRQVEAALGRARAGQRSTFEAQGVTFRGTPRWWEVRVAPVLDEQGAVQRLLAVSRDITARKQADLTLVALNADLERQVADRTTQALQNAQGQAAFMAFTEAVGTETDPTGLARQAIALLQDRFADADIGYSELEGPLWRARAWNADLAPELVAVITAGVTSEHPIVAAVLASQQPLFEDASSPARSDSPEPRMYQAVGTLPLVTGGQVCGLLAIGLRTVGVWSDPEKQLLQAVARGLTLALERAAQVRRLEESAYAQRAFLALTEDVGVQTDTLSLARQAISVLQTHLPDSHASWHTPDGDLWKARAWNPEQSASEVALITAGVSGNHPVIDQMVSTRQPVFLDRWVTSSEYFVVPPERGESDRRQSVAAYPLLLDGRLVGMLSISLNHIRPWQHQDRAVVRAVGRALTLALERADDLKQLDELATELWTRNEELQRERTFLQAVTQSMSEGLVACDEHGQLTLFNEATRAFHGQDVSSMPPEDWAGHYDLLEGDGMTPMTTGRVPLYRAWQGETLQEVKMVIRPTHGPARQVLASGGPIFSPEGRPLGAVVTMRDVTIRRAAEQQLHHSHQQLTRSNAELRAANEELEAFAYSASHDLRTPVRHVQSFAQLARKALGEGAFDAANRHLGFVEQAATRMNTLIDAMLQLSRSTRQDLRPSPVKLEDLVQQARRDLTAELEGRQVEWRLSNLLEVRGDPALLQQAVTNLLSNAVKFSRKREQPVIEVWSEEDTTGWTVFVRDNGVGFEEQYKDRLFGVFQRLHTDREFEGTGVGLATVRRIVLRHGGRVDARSTCGDGATFSFSLVKER
ncbi:PAS domain-containing protein (plasmid) [Deinococcus radiomollis]|uniref:PAS domain-containing protein n=1 Tax=Deinococcus radiomollis TaxID=468916 RepID=UPI0038925C68